MDAIIIGDENIYLIKNYTLVDVWVGDGWTERNIVEITWQDHRATNFSNRHMKWRSSKKKKI